MLHPMVHIFLSLFVSLEHIVKSVTLNIEKNRDTWKISVQLIVFTLVK